MSGIHDLGIIGNLLVRISNFLWGGPLLILLLGTGIALHLLLKAMPIRKIPYGFIMALKSRTNKNPLAKGSVSPFAALMTAIASSVGTGNIIGVATAISIGGPGAVLWLIISGLLSMSVKYSEVLLGVHFREKTDNGEHVGGPMYVIKNGLGRRWRWLATAFAIFAIITALGTGAMLQANGIAHTAHSTFDISTLLSGLVLLILTGAIILGGIQRIGSFAEKVVPVMCALYLLCGITTIIVFYKNIPHALYLILYGATHPMAAVGGFAGSTVIMAMHYGVARGLSCNESGLGTAAIAQAAGKSESPVASGIIGMMGTFIDIFIVCCSGLMVIITDAWKQPGLHGGEYSMFALQQVFHQWGPYVLSITLAFFAFTTIVGWAYFGEKAIQYLLGDSVVFPFRVIYTLLTFVGALSHIDVILQLTDVVNALMALPNLIALLLLMPLIKRLSHDFFHRRETILTKVKKRRRQQRNHNSAHDIKNNL